MPPDYHNELSGLDRSWLLYVDYHLNPCTGTRVSYALYRQQNGSTKLHVRGDDPNDDDFFVDILDGEEEADFLQNELREWKPSGRAS